MTGRQWFMRVAAVLVAGVIGAAAGAGFGSWVLGERDLSSALLIGGVTAAVAVAAGIAGAALMDGRVRSAVAAGGPYEVALRRVDGTGDHIGHRWTQAVVHVDGRRLRARRLVLGVRFFRRKAFTLDVLALRETGRRTPMRSALALLPGMPVLELDVPGGTLELATVDPMAKQLVERLGPAGESQTSRV